MRWTVKCPESGKMMRDLYLVLGPNHTIFVRAMPWAVLLFELAEKTSWGTCQEADESAWRVRVAEPPIRPKNMQRRRFKRLADELLDAWVRDASAHFGVSLDRDASGTFGQMS